MKATSFRLLSQSLFSIFIAYRIAFNFKYVSDQVGRAFDWLLAPNTIYEPAAKGKCALEYALAYANPIQIKMRIRIWCDVQQNI
jgi:hypothetical protein